MVQKKKKVSFSNVRDEHPTEVKWLPREGGERVSGEGACANFRREKAKENARRAKRHMVESDSPDSSMGYSTSDSEGDQNFSRIRAVKKTRFRAKGKPQKEGRGDMVPVRDAIEHDDEDPEAGAFRKKNEEDYRDVLFEKVDAHEIDPKCMGEHGLATIRLK